MPATMADATIAPIPGIVVSRRASFVLLHPAYKLQIEGRDSSIKFGPLLPSVGHARNHPQNQRRTALFVHQHGQENLRASACAAAQCTRTSADRAKLID
jgi:hypothetical protein